MNNKNTKNRKEEAKVIIHCLVYNHEPYLRDCLEGFVMQQTNFPFKAVVHDDCSTDNSATIIREYAEKYPHIIEPIYETENQYSKGSLGKIMDEAILKQNSYVAYCEGDDYWIDSHKLQKQVDFMEKHPECAIICTNAKVLKRDGWMSIEEKKKQDWFHHDKSRYITTVDFLHNSGYTCTLLLRTNILKSFPDVCKKCIWGDLAIKLYASLQGKAYCIAEDSAVYRALSIGSFTSRASNFSKDTKVRVEMSVVNTLDYLNNLSKYQYEKAFQERIYNHASNALLSDISLAPSLCKKYGHIFLKTTQKGFANKNIIKYLIYRFLWFPFKPGRFIEVLKKTSFTQRLKLTCMCFKSYIQKKLIIKTNYKN